MNYFDARETAFPTIMLINNMYTMLLLLFIHITLDNYNIGTSGKSIDRYVVNCACRNDAMKNSYQQLNYLFFPSGNHKINLIT